MSWASHGSVGADGAMGEHHAKVRLIGPVKDADLVNHAGSLAEGDAIRVKVEDTDVLRGVISVEPMARAFTRWSRQSLCLTMVST